MKNCTVLPEYYAPIMEIDLQKNKKLAILVNVLALLIGVVMIVPALWAIPVSTILDMSSGVGMYFVRIGTMLLGMVAYIFLHEWVHGICMNYYSGIKPNYGFTGMYAYAGSTAYFNKKSYLIVALAPIVVWGIVLLILNIVLPRSWFWVIYIIQVINVSGAAGDLYVTCRFLKLPKDILVQDSGVAMVVYSAEK